MTDEGDAAFSDDHGEDGFSDGEFDGDDGEFDGDDGEFDGDDEMDEGFAPGVVRAQVHTVCHLCGGVGEIADPVLAMRGGMPFTINPGRECPGCDGEGHLPGIQPPV